MIYWFFGLILRLTTRLFFRHIHVSNIKSVPYDKPVILAANHPGAFLDPVLLSSIFRKPVYFLVRGDVFKNPMARWFFTRINMIPIYRIDEGFENIGKNIETTQLIAKALKKMVS
jgi:1-acyl-sn-glycerol-3-phosphate acyltransferase